MGNQEHTVAVLGASNKADRFSNKAVRLLKTHQYRVLPIHPRLTEIEELPVVASLAQINEKVDTLTVYVGSSRIGALTEDIIRLNPGRVILNPGTESPELESQLDANDIPYLHACTLVMLNSRQF